MAFVKLLKDSRFSLEARAMMAEAGPEPSDPVGHYLRQWGLEMYITQFKEQATDLETLQILSEYDVKELIPVIGHRAKLNTQIKMLQTLTAPRERNVEMELYQILSSSNEGKSLLLRHKDNGLLNNTDRRQLCNIIITNELKDNPQKKITSSRLYEVAYDIPKVFKKENSSVYFIPYMSISPMQKVSAKGKLLDCYRQRRREYIKSGVIAEYSKRRRRIRKKTCKSSRSILID